MHYYKFNVGDYASHTRHLTPIEDIAYRRLLDLAYTTEKPIMFDVNIIARLINLREFHREITDVLAEFFEAVDDGWVNNRVLKEIEKTGGKSEKAKQSAKMRWDKKRNADMMRTQCEVDASAQENDANASNTDEKSCYPRPKTQDPLSEFLLFWAAYPKKVKKSAAFISWKKHKPAVDDVLKALTWQILSERWTKDGGAYIPDPTSYLNQGRWQDEQPADKPVARKFVPA